MGPSTRIDKYVKCHFIMFKANCKELPSGEPVLRLPRIQLPDVEPETRATKAVNWKLFALLLIVLPVSVPAWGHPNECETEKATSDVIGREYQTAYEELYDGDVIKAIRRRHASNEPLTHVELKALLAAIELENAFFARLCRISQGPKPD